MITNKKYYWLLFIPALFIGLYYINRIEKKPIRTLPYFGKKNSMKQGDTIYHKVKPFCFINQYNQKTTEEAVKGKIYITDFFFTTCQSICPIMSNQLERVYHEFANNKNILILSHTVSPEEDSVNAVYLPETEKVKIKVSYKYGVQIAFPQEVTTLKVS
jgi:cytochrome oxidase Cu insertion factor (SCO1/SenC/PrrC family)